MNRSITIKSAVSSLKVVEEFIESVSGEIGIGKEAYGNVMVAVMEAVNNAIIHGNGNDQQKLVHIRATEESRKLTVEVADEGKGFRPEAVPDPTRPENIENLSGRGVFLMSRLSDKIEYNEKGNSVKMLFNIVTD